MALSHQASPLRGDGGPMDDYGRGGRRFGTLSRLTLVAKADAQQLNQAIYAIGPFR